MGQQHIYLAAYGDGSDYEKTRGCYNTHDGTVYDTWYDHCEGDFAVGQHKPPGINKRTRIHCVDACGEKVRHTRTRAGHPCKGATNIKGIPINVKNFIDVAGLRDQFQSPGAFDCTFNIDAQVLKTWSEDQTRLLSRGCGKSAYEQALFGVGGTCQSDTTSDAFCAQADNLSKIVDRNGDTCFDKLQVEASAALAAQQGRTFCENNPEDEKCTCINLAKNEHATGYIGYCEENPTHAGCSEINRELLKYKAAGIVDSLHSVIGPATCLMPNACTDDQYLPINGAIPTCTNQIGICDQVAKFPEGTSVFAMRDIITKQNCSINFETEIADVCKANEDGICTQAAQGSVPLRDRANTTTRWDGTQETTSTVLPDDVVVFGDEEKKATALGVGGVSIASAAMCIFASMALLVAR